MQARAHFLLALASAAWAIHGATAQELAPLADRVLAGEGLELLQAHATPVSAEVRKQVLMATPGPQLGPGPRPFRMGYFTDLDKVEPGSIAVIGVQGIILKYGMCGVGSMERAERILEAANHPNVAAILLDTDTNGGEVAGLSTVNDAILYARQLKPVLGFINDGVCYSAGYHTLSACTEVWASHKTCGVGSIGTMCQFTDYSEADKKAGVKRVAVYATASTEKNATFRKALAGDTTALVAELDLLNEDFQARILSTRRAKIKDTKAVFNGATFSATEGVKLGLIDTIGTMQQALARCAELAKVPAPALPADEPDNDGDDDDDEQLPADPSDTPNSSQTTMKSFPLIAALAGLDPKDLQSTAQGSYIQASALEAIEGALATGEVNRQNLATANTALTTAKAELTAAQADVTAKAGEITALQARVAAAPAAAGTNAIVTGQEKAPAGAEQTEATTEWAKMDADMLENAKEYAAQFKL